MSLPPIKSQSKAAIKLKEIPKGLSISPSRAVKSKNDIVVKSERNSQKRVIKSEISLPKLINKK